MKKGLPNWLPSPLFTYYATRAKYGEENQDNGAFVRDALKSTVKDGVAMERVWPYAVGKFNVKPDQKAYDNAEKHQTLEYLNISSFDETAFLSCLSEGYPFVFGMRIYSSFMSSMKGNIPKPDKSKEACEGGHCMLCVGYLQKDGEKYLIAQNSWTALWGDKGYCYIPMEYFLEEAYDLWTIRDIEKPEDDIPDVEEVEPVPVPVVVVPPVEEPVAPVVEPTPEPAPVPEPLPLPVVDPSPVNPPLEDNTSKRYRIIAIIVFILFALLFTIIK
jgi:hypothetical protein